MRRSLLMFTLLSLFLFSAASANAGPDRGDSGLNCTPGKLHTVQLLFGMSSKDGKGVSEQQWETFLVTEVDPNFPGATVTDSQGRYLDRKNNKLYLEKAKVLTLIVECSIENERLVQDVIQKYLTRFDQDSVGKLDLQAVTNFIEKKASPAKGSSK